MNDRIGDQFGDDQKRIVRKVRGDAPLLHSAGGASADGGKLREQITSGAWPVGMRIPPEHDLVEQLGVGRTTVREALGALVHLGLLEARKGDGTYVRTSSEMHSVLMRRANTSRWSDVLELRAVLEEYARAWPRCGVPKTT
ncbi:FadR/GntR family transcriptional regulator [Streptomyces sp. NPDC056697]|uniref:FadR/GntR family transcriptional regulator n=1 Tax=Streptomyces sp. NPDC056697 TaxID=3345915 RepID=UPI0036A108C9